VEGKGTKQMQGFSLVCASGVMQWHVLRNNGSCALCLQCTETIDHLLIQCVYNWEIWFKTLRRFSWQQLCPLAEDIFADWWIRSCKLA
jgi:hypothetical protein